MEHHIDLSYPDNDQEAPRLPRKAEVIDLCSESDEEVAGSSSAMVGGKHKGQVASPASSQKRGAQRNSKVPRGSDGSAFARCPVCQNTVLLSALETDHLDSPCIEPGSRLDVTLDASVQTPDTSGDAWIAPRGGHGAPAPGRVREGEAGAGSAPGGERRVDKSTTWAPSSPAASSGAPSATAASSRTTLDLAEKKSCRAQIVSGRYPIKVPGLMQVHDFITEEEEAELIAWLDADKSLPWRLATHKAQCEDKHYGVVTNYGTTPISTRAPNAAQGEQGMPAKLEPFIQRWLRRIPVLRDHRATTWMRTLTTAASPAKSWSKPLALRRGPNLHFSFLDFRLNRVAFVPVGAIFRRKMDGNGSSHILGEPFASGSLHLDVCASK